MKKRFLFPVIALIAAILACKMPLVPGGTQNVRENHIAELLIFPKLGNGNFFVNLYIESYGPGTISCGYIELDDPTQNMQLYTETLTWERAGRRSFNFTVTKPGDYTLYCMASDENRTYENSEEILFTVTEPEVSEFTPISPTETPMPTLPPAPTQTPTATAVQMQPQVVNPGFEQGFTGWSEDPATFRYGGQSVEGTDAAHSGQRSRKLFLRWGGSHILQRINVNLGAGSQVTLTAWVKMPSPGDKDNKWFVLELWAGSADGHQEVLGAINQMNDLPNWSQLSLGPITTDFPITWLEIHARTNAGGGTYQDYDKPVWVDDFELAVIRP